MSDIIKLLPENVANQIAAGEVVQRPASVVKELLENSIDAGATHIQLIVKNAGKTLIQVVDDGCGMSKSDARMSFERHATSKISKAEDLFNLHTKGFRGEALASIAAVSQVELKTKLHDAETGIKIQIEGSKFVNDSPEAMQGGTSFSVKNLFFNIPARRNFLKKDSTELMHIMEEFIRVAMVHNDIRFTLHNNGAVMYDLPAGNRKKRITQITGTKTEEKLFEVKEYTDIISIEGYIIRPEHCRKSKEDQYFFVNGRFIRSNYLHHAVKNSMEGLISSDHQVGYYLYITVPPESVDVNIHPTKTEVKFEDEKTVYAILKSAIRQGLAQYKVTPSIDFEQEQVFSPHFDKNREIIPPTIQVDPDFNPFDEKHKSTKSGSSSVSSFKTENKDISGWEDFYEVKEEKESEQQRIAIPSEEEGLGKEEYGVTAQLHQTYILTQFKSGFIIIDQKNAHERVLYEQLIHRMAHNKAGTQQLLFPHEEMINAKEHEMLETYSSDLKNLGLDFELTTNKWVVNGVPTSETEVSPEQFIRDLLSELHEIDEKGLRNKTDMAAGMAKVMAVKRGKKLNDREIRHLVDQLFACENPNHSPSGKPTIVTFTTEFLKQQFNS